MCRRQVLEEVRLLQRQEHWRGERSLRALRDLGLALEKVEGPKTMLLVSGGTPPPDVKSNMWYSLVGDAFAAAQVSLYTVYVEQPEFGQVKYRASPTAAQDRLIDREGMENATSASRRHIHCSRRHLGSVLRPRHRRAFGIIRAGHRSGIRRIATADRTRCR